MLLSPLRLSPYAAKSLGTSFTIANSFLLDGVDEYFTIPPASLSSYLSGTNKQFTLNFIIKRNSSLKREGFFSSMSIKSLYCQFAAAGNIELYTYDGGVGKLLSTNNTFNSTLDFYSINIIYDGVTPANSKIYVNGVEEAIVTNTSTNVIDTAGSTYYIGTYITTTLPFNGYINSISVCNKVLTPTEIINLYNNGKPKNPQTLFGADCKFFFNPDNSGATAQFSVVDSVNSITATSVNMEDVDKTTVTPY